ncbi:MAG: glycosyltransferase family 2 protein [Candidatus Omnitrophica bacterium]|nr:glycosyltransferase family 2 protein [Candidatus Omnitrophota bacterium]
MADPTPLSVVVLTKNEAGRVADCLRSVSWAGEILVVDDESADDTVRIAESLGARVLRRKMDIEGRHRNWAYAQTRHEWVLSLDADERVMPELAQEIQRLLGGGPPPYETYAIPRRNYIGTRWIRHGGWYPSAQMKLFKKSVFRWEETTVHPRAFASVPWGTLQHDLIHYSYRDRQDFVRKMDLQTTLEAQKWLADGRTVKLGKALWRTVDRFVRSYVMKRGFLDGGLGWFAAWMAGKYQWLSWRKYRSFKRAGSGQPAGGAPAMAPEIPRQAHTQPR